MPTLHGLVELSAVRRPHHVCLRHGDHPPLTYADVQKALERCASHLVLLDTKVLALVADRSYGLVISLLGVLRSGKAYTPIEPDFPAARAQAMLEAADIRYALVPAQQVPQPVLHDCKGLRILAVHDDGRVCSAEEDEPVPGDFAQLPTVPDNATAYVLFTSGSTGKPKGCMVPHRGSALYAQAVVEHCNLDENMVYLLKTPYVFDVSIQDLFTAFCAGGTLEIADPGAHKDAGAIAEIIGTQGVNCACFVPTLLVEFANYLERNPEEAQSVRQSLRRVLTIGEALMTATCAQLLSHIPELEIHNLYGPTEASVGVSHFKVAGSNVESLGTVVPIGRPFPYVNFCVFDPSTYAEGQKIEETTLRAPAPGAIGELFIGGDCLASGYIKNPEKTEAAFFRFPSLCAKAPEGASPFTLYKTGDLCKVEDGIFHYMGRNDFQVKISGVRIECEEVSAVLKTHPVVGDALVTAFDGPFGKALAAYVVTTDTVDWSQEMDQGAQDSDEILNVSSWGAVYDEMYKETDNSVSAQDPTLNWSGYTDTYSRRPHIEQVIKEWVEWSCEQVRGERSLKP
ncbi:ppsC [Symbiodinium natans]|uniref:PpsC protein n=1 Tax=Symbiodinium natans TaxID=878477 RepID=A0A812U825_9DINO|nr:ppsC [Symbiodinium natans]